MNIPFRTHRCSESHAVHLCAALVGVLLLLSAPASTSAQALTTTSTAGKSSVQADLKGAFGLGLIGAEAGLVVPALFGLHETWSLLVFPAAGAAGGAVAGYFLLEQGGGHPELAVAALTTGMLLAIPAIVLTMSVSAYDPETDVESTAALTHRSANARRRAALAAAGGGLIRWTPEVAAVGAPVIMPMLAVVDSSPVVLQSAQTSHDRGFEVALLSGSF
jgi:hypothetical protein